MHFGINKQSAGQPRFLQTTQVPNNFNSTPKVAVFTDQQSVEEEAVKNGAFAAGSIILTRQVCDLLFTKNTNVISLLWLLPSFGEPEPTLSNNNKPASNIFIMAVK